VTSIGLILSSHLAASSSQSFSVPDILYFMYYLGRGTVKEAVEEVVKEVVKEAVKGAVRVV